jgi:hypothetical protein
LPLGIKKAEEGRKGMKVEKGRKIRDMINELT